MAQSTFSVRMDEKLKKSFDELCSDFGMSATTAFTIFAKAVVKERKIPFDIKASDPFYSEQNLNYLRKSVEDYHNANMNPNDLIEVYNE